MNAKKESQIMEMEQHVSFSVRERHAICSAFFAAHRYRNEIHKYLLIYSCIFGVVGVRVYRLPYAMRTHLMMVVRSISRDSIAELNETELS